MIIMKRYAAAGNITEHTYTILPITNLSLIIRVFLFAQQQMHF